jgi:hypothetical protein
MSVDNLDEPLDEEWEDGQEQIKEGYGEIMPDNTVYLSGPMKEEPEEGKVWRDGIKEKYSDEFKFLDPYNSFDPNSGRIVLDSNFDGSEEEIMVSELVETDKNMICGSEYMFVGFSNVISRGTAMEIIFAYHHNIPVFLWDRTDEDYSLSPWVIYHTVFRSTDKDEVIEVIKGWE